MITALACAAVALLVIVGTPAVYYFEFFRPKEYLLDWMEKTGAGVPPMNFTLITDKESSRRLEFGYLDVCDKGCKDDVVALTYEWTNRAHLGMSKDDIARCYQAGCIRYYHHEGHTMKVWFDKVGHAQYQYTTILTW